MQIMKERKEELDNVKQKLKVLKNNLSDVEPKLSHKKEHVSKPSSSVKRFENASPLKDRA